MTTTAKPKFRIDIGQTFKVTFRLKDSDNEPINLTGYGARFQARTSTLADGVIFLDLSTEDDTLSIDTEAGEILLNLSWETTSEYEPNSGPCELELITPDDERYIILIGTASIKYGVVR